MQDVLRESVDATDPRMGSGIIGGMTAGNGIRTSRSPLPAVCAAAEKFRRHHELVVVYGQREHPPTNQLPTKSIYIEMPLGIV